MIGRSRPSNQIIGSSPSFAWSWNVHAGVSTRSPGCMWHASPSTVVHTPSPSSTKRIADAECRCAGALSCGPSAWIAPHKVGVANGAPPSPGFASASTRRSPPRSIVMRSRALAASERSVSPCQSHGTAAGMGVAGQEVSGLRPKRLQVDRLEVVVEGVEPIVTCCRCSHQRLQVHRVTGLRIVPISLISDTMISPACT